MVKDKSGQLAEEAEGAEEYMSVTEDTIYYPLYDIRKSGKNAHYFQN